MFVMAIIGCKKDISTLNVETKRPAVVPAATLFSNATKRLSDALASGSVNTNVFRFTVSHWAMAVYQDEAQYDFSTRNIPQGWWTTMYTGVLQNLKNAAEIINADATMNADEKANKLAIIDMMQVYTFSILVNTFGNVPYSEALNNTQLFPKYDDAKTISLDLLKRLNDDLSKLKPSASGFSANEDLVYKGNVAKWVKFGNSLKMRLGMILADSDNAIAKATVESADAGAISSAADNALFTYLLASPNQNPLFVDIVTGGRSDYIAANDLMSKLIDLSDPRKSKYFGTNNAGEYAGGIVGKVNTFTDFSRPGEKVYAADAQTVFIDYAETEFLRAEAIERGYNVAGTAAIHYSNAVTASILYWGGTATEAVNYLIQPSVNYLTAPGAWREKIGTQKWIALYNRPFDGWVELRRLDFPKITPPVGAKSGFPNRFPYPNNEQQLNGANYTSAAAAIGGDKVETKLFWDKL